MPTSLRKPRRNEYLGYCCLACVLSAGLAMSVARAQDAAQTPDPFTAVAEPGQPTGGPSTNPSSALGIEIPIARNSDVTFGPAGCPVLVNDNHVWDLRTNTIQAELDAHLQSHSVTALSQDGKYFAAGLKSQDQEDTTVGVWSTQTGKSVCQIPGIPKRFVDLMIFSRNKYLILGGRSTPDLQVWDVEQGKQIKSIDLKGDRIERGKVAFSPNGEFFVAVVKKQLTLFRTTGARPVTVMRPPRKMVNERIDLEPKPAPAPAPTPAKPALARPARPKPAAAPLVSGDANDAVFVYAWLQAMQFSPDGKEIAAISTHPSPRLIVWDTTGKLLFDEPLILPPMVSWAHTLQWFPDKKALLVSGFIVDRDLKKPVFGIRGHYTQDAHVRVLDADHIIGTLPSNPGQLQSYEVPWKQIRRSIALMRDPKAGLMSPAQPVSVSAEFGSPLAGDAAQTASVITEALRRRLGRDGIDVSDGSSATFTLKLSEKAGDSLPIYERQSRFDFRGNNTGRTATERIGSLMVELTIKGQDAPLWRESLQAVSGRSFQAEINDASIRKSMLESLIHQMQQLYLPYFIPEDEQELALPVVLQ